MPKRQPVSPRIDSVLATTGRGAGRAIRLAQPGDTIRLLGAGFGRAPQRVTVCFDAYEAAPYALPFTDSGLIVTVPLIRAATETLVVRVGRNASQPRPFTVKPARMRRRRPGSVTAELFGAVDEFAAQLSAFAVRAAPATPFAPELRRAAALAEGTRVVMRRNLELLDEWLAPQAFLARTRQPFQALRTIERMDEAIADGGLIDQVRGISISLFGPAGVIGRMAGEKLADWLFGDGADELAEAISGVAADVFDLIGFVLTEGAKVLEGIENILKIFVPSASVGGFGGAGAGLSIDIDVSFSPGEGVSAFAKAVDFGAQIFDKVGETISDGLRDGRIDQIEEKLDRQGDGVVDLGRKADRQETKLDALETKADRDAGAVEQLEAKADREAAALERLEVKADRDTELLGLLESKADRQAQQIGALEVKADRAEQKLDTAEVKADRAEEKLDRLESKADRLEVKSDRHEAKLDTLEVKGDRAESKLDRQEQKLDRGEVKLDALEVKADAAEVKLDRLEVKLDRQEEKLDREEVKLDRLVLPVPLEGSVATQQGSGQRLSAAVAATRGQDNAVHLRAAIDQPASRLDEQTAWSQWTSFGRPGTALGLLEVSLDLHYTEGSDTELTALLSARDQRGNVFHRALEAGPQQQLLDPARWTDWQSFLLQP